MRLVNYSVFYKDLKNHGLEYAARHTRALGCDAVEFLDFAPTSDFSAAQRYTATEVRRILEEHQLKVACYSVAVDLLCDDRERAMPILERQIEGKEGK